MNIYEGHGFAVDLDQVAGVEKYANTFSIQLNNGNTIEPATSETLRDRTYNALIQALKDNKAAKCIACFGPLGTQARRTEQPHINGIACNSCIELRKAIPIRQAN